MLEPSQIEPQEIRPLKRIEYERLVAEGAFEDDHVELIRGILVTMAPNDPEHASPIEILTGLLVRGVGDRARVRVQLPVIAADESEPEPDLAVVPPRSYAKRHPDEVFLVVEVAASSLKKDRDVKAPLYAASGFPEYWLVDVRARRVEVFRRPAREAYADVSSHGLGSRISPVAFPDVDLSISALFE